MLLSHSQVFEPLVLKRVGEEVSQGVVGGEEREGDREKGTGSGILRPQLQPLGLLITGYGNQAELPLRTFELNFY